MTTIYLAVGSSLTHMARALSMEPAPSVLCSYVYYPRHRALLMREVGIIRDWILDSGAYSAKHSGREIGLGEYIDFCHKVMESKSPPSAIFALDVIGDWRASMSNTEAMWKAGVQAIPCYHAGEPTDVLVGMARDYPRIAIGGVAGIVYGKDREKYLRSIFGKVWPKRVHGFGISTIELCSAFPFDSVDASSWEIGALRYGQWRSKGRLKTPWLRTGHNLRSEVEHYLDMESQLRARWGALLKNLEDAGCGRMTAET